MTRFAVACGLAAVLAAPASAAGSYFDMSYPPSDRPGELRYAVTFTAWLPPGVGTLRGVIVHQHGCGSGACKGGQTAAHDLHWQALAKKWDCALLGPSYGQRDGDDCRLWCDPRNGSRTAFLRALHDLGERSKHPELESVPWCLWGHSGGGFWASLMTASDPERVVAAWLRSGTAFTAWEKGEVPKPALPDAVFGVPTVCNPGVKERDDKRFRGAWDGALAMMKAYRAKDAPIAFAPDPRTGHECGDSRYLAVPFFDACLAARLPDKGSTNQGLRPIDRAGGWRAPLPADAAVPADRFTGSPTEASWLPDERVAKAWAEYVRTGAVGDTTPPPPPTAVVAKLQADGTIELTWDAEADIESGLRGFVVRRDGADLATVPEKPVGRFGRPLFQSMSYHDTPEPPLPAMRFVDGPASPSKSPEYRIVAINGVGLRSEPSAAAR